MSADERTWYVVDYVVPIERGEQRGRTRLLADSPDDAVRVIAQWLPTFRVESVEAGPWR